MNKAKVLSVAIAAAMLSSVAALTVNASNIASRDDLASHSVGLCGSFNGWGSSADVKMTEASAGVYTGTIDIPEVTADMIGELESDGTKTGKYGVQFKVRLDESWDDSWGDYEEDYGRTANSQTNMLVEDVKEGDALKINVTFDTTKAHPSAEDGDPEDPVTWYVSFTTEKGAAATEDEKKDETPAEDKKDETPAEDKKDETPAEDKKEDTKPADESKDADTTAPTTGDATSAAALVGVVLASLGTAVVMTKKASKE